MGVPPWPWTPPVVGFFHVSGMGFNGQWAWLVLVGKSPKGLLPTIYYPLVNIQKTMEIHHFESFWWVYQLFLWPFWIAICNKLPAGNSELKHTWLGKDEASVLKWTTLDNKLLVFFGFKRNSFSLWKRNLWVPPVSEKDRTVLASRGLFTRG